MGRVRDPEEARAFVRRISAEFPDATHNCWAFAAGAPGSTTQIGMSDDGEPQGTAGRPILTALLHSKVGEIGAVVTRYYGGVKLGKGGLGRAYAGGVRLALESLPLARRIDRVRAILTFDYPAVDPVLQLLDRMEVLRTEENFGARIRIDARVPEDRLDALRREFDEITSGVGELSVE